VGDMVGRTLKVDSNTTKEAKKGSDELRGKYTHICVEVDL